MRYMIITGALLLSACSKEPDVEVAQNKLTVSASVEVNGTSNSYNNFNIEPQSGLPYSIYSIPTTDPIIKMECFQLRELDSFSVSTQKVNLKYFSGSKVYLANDKTGDGYIICTLNRNSEINVNIRDGAGNIKPALKRNENFEARFRFRAVNQAAPFDTVVISNGKLVRNGYYYVY